MKYFFITAVLLFMLMPVCAAYDTTANDAATSEIVPGLADAADAGAVERAVPDSARNVTEGISPNKLPDINKSVNNILSEMAKQISPLLRGSLKSLMLILGIIILCGVAGVMFDESEKELKIVPLAAIISIAAVIGGHTHSLLTVGRTAIGEMDAFSKVLLPSLAIASATAGAPTAAFARQMATMSFSGILIDVTDKLLIPMTYAYYAVVTCNALTGKNMLPGLAKLIKWLTTGLLTILLTAFVTYLTISSVISGSADAIAMKSTRMLMSGAVPVVGGIIADAAETVLAGAAIVRNAIGIFGLVAVLGVCLTPFLRIGIQTLVFKLISALASPLTDARLVTYLDEVSGVFSLILALVASSAFLLLISLISAIIAGGGL